MNDAEERLLSNSSISKQIHSDDFVTRDAIHDFINNVDGAARNAKGSFEDFEKNNKDATNEARAMAAQASIIQGSMPIVDASGSSNASVDQKFDIADLKAVAGSKDSGVPDPLRKAAQTYTDSANFQTLSKAGDAGDGLVNDKGLNKVVSENVGAARQDKSVHDYLNNLGDAVSDDDKKKLAQVGDDATTLKSWFDSHERGDPSLNDRPKAVADAQDRLLGNDAVKKRITADSGDDKGKVTRDTLGGFLNDLNKAHDNAKGSWDAFKKDNPNPDPIAKRGAVNASILQANLPILDAAGSDAAKVDGKINIDDLKGYAAKDSKSPLGTAAAAYANEGEFNKIDVAGDAPSVAKDGIAANENFDKFLSSGTSKTSGETISSAKNSAMRQAVKDAGGDASKVTPDYFKDPSKSNLSGADKTAALMQLSDTASRMQAGFKAYGKDGDPTANRNKDEFLSSYNGETTTPGEMRANVTKELEDKISTLGQDKDVQAFMSEKMPKALQEQVAKDPGLKASFEKELQSSSSSKALEDAFNAKDKDGKPVSTTAALSNFTKDPSFYAQALGKTPDFAKAFEGAPQEVKDKIKQGYDDITSGKAMNDLAKTGVSPENALLQSAVDKTAYDSVLDKQTVEAGTDKFNNTAAAQARNQLTDGKSGDDMIKALGVSGVDDPKLEKFVEDNVEQLMGKGTDGQAAADILSTVRQVVDAIRGGAKFDDAMSKAQKGWKSKFPDTTADYKTGVFHAASGLLLAGAMGARLAGSGGNSNPLQTAQQSLSAAGLLTEGGTKFALANTKEWAAAEEAKKKVGDYEKAHPGVSADDDPEYKRLTDDAKTAGNNLKKVEVPYKDWENVGKSVGGVAGNALGLISGVLGAKSAAENGDIGAAAAQGVFAGLNGISAVASVGEVVTYAVPRIAGAAGSALSAEAAAGWAAAGGWLGAVGGVVGGVAAVGGLIYSLVTSIQADLKQTATEESWYNQVKDGLKPTDIKLPDRFTLLSPEFGYSSQWTS